MISSRSKTTSSKKTITHLNLEIRRWAATCPKKRPSSASAWALVPEGCRKITLYKNSSCAKTAADQETTFRNWTNSTSWSNRRTTVWAAFVPLMASRIRWATSKNQPKSCCRFWKWSNKRWYPSASKNKNFLRTKTFWSSIWTNSIMKKTGCRRKRRKSKLIWNIYLDIWIRAKTSRMSRSVTWCSCKSTTSKTSSRNPKTNLSSPESPL